MKKALLFLILVVFLLPSCKKDKTQPSNQSKTCQLTAYKVSGQFAYYYSYDGQSRLTDIKYYKTAGLDSRAHFTYENGKYKAKEFYDKNGKKTGYYNYYYNVSNITKIDEWIYSSSSGNFGHLGYDSLVYKNNRMTEIWNYRYNQQAQLVINSHSKFYYDSRGNDTLIVSYDENNDVSGSKAYKYTSKYPNPYKNLVDPGSVYPVDEYTKIVTKDQNGVPKSSLTVSDDQTNSEGLPTSHKLSNGSGGSVVENFEYQCN